MTIVSISAEAVGLLRSALLSELGSPACQLEQVSVTYDKEKHPEWFHEPLAELDRYRKILDLLGWMQPDSQEPLSLDLEPYRDLIATAMRVQLRVERDFMSEHANVEGAAQQRETATRNAHVIEEFLTANGLTDRA